MLRQLDITQTEEKDREKQSVHVLYSAVDASAVKAWTVQWRSPLNWHLIILHSFKLDPNTIRFY